jgi:hypothetical protein
LPRPSRTDSPAHGRNFLVGLISTIGLTFLGLCAIALVCLFTVPPIPHGPAFDAQYSVTDGFFYAGQPAKTAAYQAGCVALPFLIALSFWLSRRWTQGLSVAAADRVIGIGIGLYLLLMLSCGLPIVYCPHPPFWILPPSWILLPMNFSHPFLTPSRILFLLIGGGLEYYFLTSAPSRRNANRATMLLLVIWFLLIPSRFYLPSNIDDNLGYLYHLNAVLDAVSQAVNGHHILVDYPHIYGGYPEMLAPVIRLFPRGVGVLLAALAIPALIGMLCLLLTARLVIRRPAVLFVTGLALLGANYLPSFEDLYYGFLTARFFLPPVGLLAATLYFQRPGPLRYAAMTILAVAASIWNLDTGLVLWASWLGTLVIMKLAARDIRGLAFHMRIQILTLCAGWMAFFLYLRLSSGQWPDGGLVFYFQKIVVESGYFCLPLLFPDMWVFILSIYVISLALVFGASLRGKPGRLTPIMLMLSLYGIGTFSYFMGRSAPSNLVAVAYPAVLLAGIICSRAEMKMRRGILPANTRFLLLPTRIALLYWAFLMVAALPDFLPKILNVARNWNNPEQTPFRANVAFINRQVHPLEDGVYFLSNHSGFYYYLSDTVRPIKIPGTVELLRAKDMNALIEAIRTRQFSKLFVEQNFYAVQMYRPDLYDTIRTTLEQNYRVSETGPTGKLLLYTPR